MDKKGIIYEFIGVNPFGTISTVNSQNKPGSAVVDLIALENLEVLFNTYTTSRKYKNLKNNPNVSIVVWDGDKIQIQYEGIAQEIEGTKLENYKAYYNGKTNWRIWKIKEYRYFKVTPSWIKFSDFTRFPEKTFEINF